MIRLLPALVQLLLVVYCIQDFHLLRSQNAFYHSQIASQLWAGQSLKELGILAHSQMQGSFVDQHFLFHVVLGGLQQLTSSGMALLILSTLGLLSLTWLLSFALRKEHWALGLCLPLLMPWLLEPVFIRWVSGRPGIWGIFFLILSLWLFSTSEKTRLRQSALFCVAFLWAGHSLIAAIAIPCALLWMYLTPQTSRDFKSLGILVGGLVLGGFTAMGLDSFWFSAIQIKSHVFQNSGVYEWSPSTRYQYLSAIPLLIALGIFLRHQTSPFTNPRARYFLFLAVGFGILCLLQARWLEFAWPLSILALGLNFRSLGTLSISELRWKWVAGLTLVLVTLQVHSLKDKVQSDRSVPDGLHSFLSVIHERFPDSEKSLTLDWTAWSVDFYLNPKSKMEPGFSLAFYNHRQPFLNAFHSLARGDNRNRYAYYSLALKTLGTEYVIASESSTQLDQNQSWFEVLYRSGGWVLARVAPALSAIPAQLESNFSEKSEVFKLCEQNLIALQYENEDPIMVENSKDCLSELEQFAGRPLNQNAAPRIIKLYFNPTPLRDLTQVLNPASRGFFAMFDPLTGKIAKPEDFQSPLEGQLAVNEVRTSFDPSDIQYFGRRSVSPNPRGAQLCEAYQNAARRFLDHSNSVFDQWTKNATAADSLRAQLGLGILCSRPQFIPLSDKRRFGETCLRFKTKLEVDAQNLEKALNEKRPGSWSDRLIVDMLALQLNLPSPLRDVSRHELLIQGRVASHITQSPQGLQNLRTPIGEVFSSGHYALWWTRRWQALRAQGLIPSASEQDDFENFAVKYEKIWRRDLNYNSFAIRWWSEALVNAYQQYESRQASHWMEQFFRASETFVQGSTVEKDPNCLGPRPPGIGELPYPEQNVFVIWEGLEQARRVNFPWWSEKEEELLLKLLRCTLSLQKTPLYWPERENGEFAMSTGDGRWRPDIQGHALNALGFRIENDKIRCQ